MFAKRYYGIRYYGPRYWGNGNSTAGTVRKRRHPAAILVARGGMMMMWILGVMLGH